MNRSALRCTPVLLAASLLAAIGCSRSASYTPVEPDEEQKALAAELAPLRHRFKQAHAVGEGYALVAVLDRDYQFDDFPEWEKLTRVLIAHGEQLDLDDYGFSEPGKEASEEGQLDGVLGQFFWVDEEGTILFDEMQQPPGTLLVVEWFVPSGISEATLHFGGNPCLTFKLDE